MATNVSEFMRYVTPEVIGCDDITITNATRNAIIEFCQNTWILQKGFSDTPAASSIDADYNDSYDIDTSSIGSYIKPIGICELRINGVEWTPEYAEIVNDVTYFSNMSDEDVKYFYFPDSSTIRIYPFSTSVEIYMMVAFAPLRTATTFDDFLYDDWVEPIAAGAKYKIMAIPGKNWSNPDMAQYYYSVFKQGMSDAKRRMNKKFSKKASTVYPRVFGDYHA